MKKITSEDGNNAVKMINENTPKSISLGYELLYSVTSKGFILIKGSTVVKIGETIEEAKRFMMIHEKLLVGEANET